jgi:hypothetical protein
VIFAEIFFSVGSPSFCRLSENFIIRITFFPFNLDTSLFQVTVFWTYLESYCFWGSRREFRRVARIWIFGSFTLLRHYTYFGKFFVLIGWFDVPLIFLKILGRACSFRRVAPILIFGFFTLLRYWIYFFWFDVSIIFSGF